MKAMPLILGLAAAAALAGAVRAQPEATTTICLNPGGQARPVTCRSHDASRINQQDDICQCLHGGQEVTVAICPAGVKAPPESAAFERARYAAVSKGSLVGASWQGRPICVAPRNRLGGD